MTHLASVAVIAPETFGRDGAMFESLLGFVGQLSVVLWGLVMFTAVIRFVSIRIYRRSAARTAPVETVAPTAAVPATAVPAAAVPTITAQIDLAVTNASFDEGMQSDKAPVAVAASVKVPHRTLRYRRAEARHAAHVPALASNSTES